MNKETVYLQYAHCVKFTEGKLDRDPWSMYELRQLAVELQYLAFDDGSRDWRVWLNGKCLACEDAREDALALATYKLMDDSRHLQRKINKAILKAFENDPKEGQKAFRILSAQ